MLGTFDEPARPHDSSGRFSRPGPSTPSRRGLGVAKHGSGKCAGVGNFDNFAMGLMWYFA